MSTNNSPIPFYMTPETSRALIEHGRALQAKMTRARAVAEARKAIYLERRDGRDRRINQVPSELLDGAEKRWRERRFKNSRHAALDLELP